MTLDLGYRSTATLGAATTDGLVIMCSDRRFRGPSEEFLQQHLQLRSYDLVGLPGGVYMLSFAEALPRNLKLGMRMVRFLMKNHLPPRIVLIGHENCSRYAEGFASWLKRPGFSLEQKQRHDIQAVAAELRQSFPGVRVDGYFARAVPGDLVDFEPA